MKAPPGNDGRNISSSLRKGLVHTADSKGEENERFSVLFYLKYGTNIS
jgi:hypothetical protein